MREGYDRAADQVNTSSDVYMFSCPVLGWDVRIVLWAHGPTSAVRTAAFPADEPLDAGATAQAVDVAPTLPRVDAVHSPDSKRCRQTAAVLGREVADDPALRGLDHGSWSGRTLDDVGAADPAGLGAWLTDPDARPHGGESMTDLVARVGNWLDGRTDPPHALLAVADAAVVRAAVVHALGAPAQALWRVDVAPLSATLLVGEPGRWSLRSIRPPGR
ncbi:histidine phosphatase family protein [Pseudonocardia sp. GCM10023141]|uniref:histidine phosphatase family protein n=1 Tax=Pseudonocardia sp. GCM10023141 TaxID=3252653 RepID=UPI003619C6A1